MFLVSYFLYSITSWEKLSERYRIEKKLSSSFLIIQEQIYINRIAINRFNIGVSDKGLFLSFSSLMGLAFSSLLIPWDEISYGQDIDNNSRRDFVLNLGNPKIASLQLSSHTIEKIHENYGEPIFFERLREPS
ncbi:hypothetical protein C7B62_18005 [Pleurocapsa sp. CCALA 161]|nr:hypothetical protein C7B62_18005 [Pleurocapsa sp. CCALA 161]